MKKLININIKEVWHNCIDNSYSHLLSDIDTDTDFGIRYISPEDINIESKPDDGLVLHNLPAGTPQVEFTTAGTIEKRDGKLSISYEESEITGMEGTVTRFDIMDDGCVTFSRTGSYNLHLVFESGKRYICSTKNDILPYSYCVTTRNLKNLMSYDGGSIDIDYSIDINGAETEHNEFCIKVDNPNQGYES